MTKEDYDALQEKIQECISAILFAFVSPDGVYANVVIQLFEVDGKGQLCRDASSFACASKYEPKSIQGLINDYCERACNAAMEAMDNEPFNPQEKESEE